MQTGEKRIGLVIRGGALLGMAKLLFLWGAQAASLLRPAACRAVLLPPAMIYPADTDVRGKLPRTAG
jgi:hypothetical protein